MPLPHVLVPSQSCLVLEVERAPRTLSQLLAAPECHPRAVFRVGHP